MTTDNDIQEAIDRAVNLSRIRTSIEVLRELEINESLYSNEYDESDMPTYYLIYKDIKGVEKILLHEYGNSLGHIYWRLYKFITNIIQPYLFENIFDLRKLEKVVEKIDVLEPTSQYSNIPWFDYEVNYIEKRNEILSAFKTMLDWVDDKISKGLKPYEREAYNSEFLKK